MSNKNESNNKIQNFNQYEDHLDDIIHQYKSRKKKFNFYKFYSFI